MRKPQKSRVKAFRFGPQPVLDGFYDEQWREIPGYDGRYVVSDHGRVRVTRGRHGAMVLQPFTVKGQDYLRVTLYKDGVAGFKQRGIHQLVALAWLGPRPEGLVVNHKDGRKTNNHVSNLEYVTPRRNSEHAKEMGLLARCRGERNGMAKLTVDAVMDIKWLILGGFTNQQLASDFCVHHGTIQLIRTGRNWPLVPWEKWSPEGERAARAAMEAK